MFHILLFLLTYIAGFFGSLFINPVYAFALYEAVYFFNPLERWWGASIPGVSYSFFVVLLVIGVLVLNYKSTVQNKLLQVPPFRWMYLFFLVYLVTYFYAVLPNEHLDSTIEFLKSIIIISIAYKLCDTVSKLDYVLYGYIFGVWYICLLTFQIGRNSGDRVEGIGTVDAPDANGVSAAIAPALVLCLYYFWTNKKWWGKLAFMLAGAFIANGLILINSRGAFLGAGASILFFMYHMYFSSFQRKYQKTMAIFIVVAGLLGGSLIIDDSFIQRIDSMKNVEAEEGAESGATRTFFWIAAMDMARDFPLGGGVKAFEMHADHYLPLDIDTGGSRQRAVHSTWFEALTQVGYFGLFAFFMMLYSSFRVLQLCKKQLRKDGEVDEYFKVIAIQGVILSFIVSMTFLNRMRAEVLYWFVLYAACAYNIYVLKANAKDESGDTKKP